MEIQKTLLSLFGKSSRVVVPRTIAWTTAVQLYHNNFRLVGGMLLQNPVGIFFYLQVGCQAAKCM